MPHYCGNMLPPETHAQPSDSLCVSHNKNIFLVSEVPTRIKLSVYIGAFSIENRLRVAII